jgi:hypothetical protein
MKVQRLENKLYYTDEEILIMFKESKEPEIELKILAELNLTSQENIRHALIRAGYDPLKIPKKYQRVNNREIPI